MVFILMEKFSGWQVHNDTLRKLKVTIHRLKSGISKISHNLLIKQR